MWSVWLNCWHWMSFHNYIDNEAVSVMSFMCQGIYIHSQIRCRLWLKIFNLFVASGSKLLPWKMLNFYASMNRTSPLRADLCTVHNAECLIQGNGLATDMKQIGHQPDCFIPTGCYLILMIFNLRSYENDISVCEDVNVLLWEYMIWFKVGLQYDSGF